MNKTILIGRLSKDPEVRYTQGAEPVAVCNFSVAVDKPYSKNRAEGEPTADFINCVAFGRTGETIGKYFYKGDRIALQGRIQTSSYTDQQGNKKYATKVVCEVFEFVESKTNKGGGAPEHDTAGFMPDESDGELPF